MSLSEDDDLDGPSIKSARHKTALSSVTKAVHPYPVADYSTSLDSEELSRRNIKWSDEHRTKRSKPDTNLSGRLEWSDGEGEDVGTAAYKKYKARKQEARKRAARSNKKAKIVEKQRETKLSEGHTGVGAHHVPGRPKRKLAAYDDPSSDEDLMEWTMPEYVQQRRAEFDDRSKRLREGGLMLPPEYEGILFSDDENLADVRERPDFPSTVPPTSYRDIDLPYSRGIIPAPVAQYLRDYQVEGVAFLHEIFVYQRGGILGDDMGLGKTIQVIAFLTSVYGKTGDERDGKRMRKMRKDKRWYPRTLIICPGSLMANWQDEFNRWGWWHSSIYHGPGKQDVLEAAQAGMIEVMITTYQTYQRDRGAINMVRWDCVVADECHQVKNRRAEITVAMNEVNALCRIGLTGTAIQNKYEELWTLLNWTSPGQLGPISTWKATVSEPLKLGQSHNATIYELARARKTAKKLVQNLLPRFFLRRMKTLIKDQLPKKTDRVVFCPLTPTQADAYQNFIDCDIVQMIRNSGELCDCGSQKKSGWCCHMRLEDGTVWQAWVFPAIVALQKTSNHLALLIPSGNDTKDKQAKDLEILEIAAPDKWKKLYATRDNILNNSNPEFCGKWRILRKLLKFWHDQGGNKVLVFSHSVRLLKMLHDLFMSSSYSVKYLDGSMKYEERYAAVQDFNSDPTLFVFLISTKAGGVGLNITSANKVVVVDPNWNPSYDLQAQDRAYRIGQTRDVEVFRLISQGTLEEIVYARQIYKQQQANIGYNATEERRYFRGVQDRKDQKGEIFGLQNLFAYEHENVVLRDIVNKTNIAESKADIQVASLELEDGSGLDQHGDGERNEDDLGDPAVKLESDHEDAAISQLAAEIRGEAITPKSKSKSKSTATSFNASFLSDASASEQHQHHDPVQAILAGAGVTYTHENSEVVGSSRVEAKLSKRAEEAEIDPQQLTTRVFHEESQSQNLYLPRSNSNDSQRTFNLTHDRIHDNDENKLAHKGNSTPLRPQFKYKYNPPEDIQRRQFCSMATWAGFGIDMHGVEEFAARVEVWTQEQRREFLEAFYLSRRECLWEEEKEIFNKGDRGGGGRADSDDDNEAGVKRELSIKNEHGGLRDRITAKKEYNKDGDIKFEPGDENFVRRFELADDDNDEDDEL